MAGHVDIPDNTLSTVPWAEPTEGHEEQLLEAPEMDSQVHKVKVLTLQTGGRWGGGCFYFDSEPERFSLCVAIEARWYNITGCVTLHYRQQIRSLVRVSWSSWFLKVTELKGAVDSRAACAKNSAITKQYVAVFHDVTRSLCCWEIDVFDQW